MRCALVQDLFSEVYDGVAERQTAIEKHLKKCPTCAAEYEAYKQMLIDLRHLPEPELPLGFHESIMEKIQTITPPNDHTIDDLLGEIETRNRIREATKIKQRSVRAAVMVRRWAGVASAACILFGCLWMVHAMDFPLLSRFSSDGAVESEASQHYAAPEMAEIAQAYAMDADDIAAEFEQFDIPIMATEADLWANEYEESAPEDTALWDAVDEDFAENIAEPEAAEEPDPQGRNLAPALEPEGFAQQSTDVTNATTPPPAPFTIGGDPQPLWIIPLALGIIALCTAIGASFWIANTSRPKKSSDKPKG